MAIWKDPVPAGKASEPARFDLASPEPPAAEPTPAATTPKLLLSKRRATRPTEPPSISISNHATITAERRHAPAR